MNRIEGKIAVITGGTQGLGAAIATLFANAGAVGIVIVGRDVEKGRAKAAEITDATGVRTEMVAADLGDIEDVRNIMMQTDFSAASIFWLTPPGSPTAATFSTLRPTSLTGSSRSIPVRRSS